MIQNNNEFCNAIDGLIEGWCNRRALGPLRIILPVWPPEMGLTDEWHRIREALRHTRAMQQANLSETELHTLNELLAAVDKILF